MTKFKSQGFHIIRIKCCGSPPSLIPLQWNIDILHYKQAKLRKDMQHSVGGLKMTTFCQRSYHRKCQRRRGVGGQKKKKIVNVVCERPEY